jgi:lysozyme family protein
MADFSPALNFLLPHEGGYSFDPHDAGGRTKFGISQRSYPDIDIENLTLEEASKIYKRDYWDPFPYAKIESQEVANKVFDLCVNMGSHQAHKILQRGCCEAGMLLTVDGVLGPVTLRTINSLPERELLSAIKGQATDFYRKLAEDKPTNAKFLHGWLVRANA